MTDFQIINTLLHNADDIIVAAERAGIILPAACALMEKESRGRNVYGNDVGGMLAGFPAAPNEDNFHAFWYMVLVRGHQSNGVGPAQITSRGLLSIMITRGLKPWNVTDNMQFGFELLERYKREANGSWAAAGTRYNGSSAYGEDLALKVKQWRERLGS